MNMNLTNINIKFVIGGGTLLYNIIILQKNIELILWKFN